MAVRRLTIPRKVCGDPSGNRHRYARRRWIGIRGSTLLDVIVALGLGTFVLLGACQFLISTAVSSSITRQNNQAYNAARAALENIRLYQGGVLTTGSYSDATVFGPIPQLTELPGGSASAVIKTYRTGTYTTVKIITVTITWTSSGTQGGFTKTRTRKITALVAPGGAMP